uniref:Glutathione S-transferase n=1 Tax=Strongyloides stercoralis TaxID=6248 RepID=A0AAF5DFB7_STRER
MTPKVEGLEYDEWVEYFFDKVNTLSYEYCTVNVASKNDDNKFEETSNDLSKIFDKPDFNNTLTALYSHFAEKSKDDGGKSFCTFLERFIYVLNHVKDSEEYGLIMAKYTLESLLSFKLNNTSIGALIDLIQDLTYCTKLSNLFKIASLIKSKITGSEAGNEVPKHFIIASTIILQKIHLYNELSSEDGDDQSGAEFVQQFFFDILDNSDSSKFSNAFRLTSCFNLPDIYRLYIENVFSTTFENFSIIERADFLQKCLNFITDMDEKDVYMLFDKYFNCWSSLSCDEIMSIKGMFLDFHKLISNDKGIVLKLLSMLKCKMASIMGSSFGFIVAIILCSSKIYSEKSVGDVTNIFIRLWKSSFDLDNNAWLIHVIGTSPASTWRGKFNVLFNVINMDGEYKEMFVPGIEHLCLSLISRESTDGNQELKNNSLNEEDSIVVLGRWIFLEVINTDPTTFQKCIEFLLGLIRNSFGSKSVCIFFIDILVNVVKRNKLQLNECWKLISSFIENIFKVPDGDLCCTVVRALLPVIMEHVELRKIVFEEVKICVRQTATHDKIIPLIFYLLRAVTEQAAVIEMNNYSQSFATYATLSAKNPYKKTPDEVMALNIYAIIKKCLHKGAVAKSILYKCLVDNCNKNSNIIPHSLSLLLEEMHGVNEISMDKIITIDNGVVIINKPLPQLIAAITRIMRLSVSRDINNSVTESNGFKLEGKVEILLNQMREKTLDDLKISSDSYELMVNIEKAKNIVFASMMLQMYNISLEYMWSFGNIVNDKKSCDSFISLLLRRGELENIISCVKKSNIKVKDSDLTSCFDRLSPIELDDKILSSMLTTIVEIQKGTGCDTKILSEENCIVLTRFVVQCFYEKIENIDGFNVHGILNMKMLTDIALNLYQIFYIKEGSFFSQIPFNDHLRSIALEGFIRIVIYITKKYGRASEPSLTTIFNEILVFHGSKEENQIKPISDDQYINSIGKYYCFFMFSGMIHTVGLEDEFIDTPEEMLIRGKAFLKLFNHIIDTIPNAFWSIKKRFLLDTCKSTMKVYTRSNMAQITEIANELWKIVFKLVYTSQIYSNNSINKMLSTIIDSIIVALASREEEDEKYSKRTLKSITYENVNGIFNMYIHGIQKMINNMETSIQIYLHLYNEFTDDFLVLLLNDCDIIMKYVCDVVETSVDYDCNKSIVTEMLTNSYKALTCIINQFISKCGHKKEMLEWKCLDSLSSLINGTLKGILKICKEEFFKENNDLNNGKMVKSKKKNMKIEHKKTDTLLRNYNLAIKYFELAILNLNSKVGDNRFSINDSASESVVDETV